MSHPSRNSSKSSSLLSGRFVAVAVLAVLLLPLISACSRGGGESKPERTGEIEWRQGDPPGQIAQTTDQESPDAAVTQTVEIGPTETRAPTETPFVEPTEPAEPGAVLTPDELALYEPNELGVVPVLMYHNIVPEYEDGQEGDVLWRTIDEFKADLQWLYDRDFYVVPIVDYVTNNIDVPAGKHPFVLTFDDSRPSQFYYLENGDGTVTIDPNSAIGILEEFFASHPDFGHTAFFSLLPIWCFDFEEPGQTPYCDEKLRWLVDHGYEVGNHTWDHQDLSDVSNEVFQKKIVETAKFIEERVPEGKASRVLILPYGNFPGGANAEQQWDWIRNGWTFDGEPFHLLSVVAAGADPAPSPADIDFDIMSIARIGAKDYPSDGEPDLFFDYWFGVFEESPGMLYRSDGNPDIVTVPEWAVDDLDQDKVIAEGKEIVTY